MTDELTTTEQEAPEPLNIAAEDYEEPEEQPRQIEPEQIHCPNCNSMRSTFLALENHHSFFILNLLCDACGQLYFLRLNPKNGINATKQKPLPSYV